MAFALFLATIGGFLCAYNEGIVTGIEQDGFKATMSQEWAEREPVDYTKMND